MGKKWLRLKRFVEFLWLILFLFLPYGKVANVESIGNLISMIENEIALRYVLSILALFLILDTINAKAVTFNEFEEMSDVKIWRKSLKKVFFIDIFFIILILGVMHEINQQYLINFSPLVLVLFSVPVFLVIRAYVEPILLKNRNEDSEFDGEGKVTKVVLDVLLGSDDEEDEEEEVERKRKIPQVVYIILVICMLPIHVLCIHRISPNTYNCFTDKYATVYGADFGVPERYYLVNELYNGERELSFDDAIFLKLGEFSIENYGFNHWKHYDDDFVEKEAIGKKYTCTYYSDNYEYLLEVIKRLEKEQKELLYGALGSSSEIVIGDNLEDIEERFEEEIKKAKEINKKIDALKKGFTNLNYEYMTFTYHKIMDEGMLIEGTVIDEVLYDTNPNSDGEIKWGKEKNWLQYPIAKESITLSQSEFEVGTDFTQTKIGVKIFYNDGSMKLTYITPDNASQLNGKSRGKYLIFWSDSWGTYEKEIEIV